MHPIQLCRRRERDQDVGVLEKERRSGKPVAQDLLQRLQAGLTILRMAPSVWHLWELSSHRLMLLIFKALIWLLEMHLA